MGLDCGEGVGRYSNRLCCWHCVWHKAGNNAAYLVTGQRPADLHVLPTGTADQLDNYCPQQLTPPPSPPRIPITIGISFTVLQHSCLQYVDSIELRSQWILCKSDLSVPAHSLSVWEHEMFTLETTLKCSLTDLQCYQRNVCVC